MEADPKKSRVKLFHFNDFHRRLKPLKDGSGGADRLVGKIRELESEHPDAITVNLGDVAGDNSAQGPDHFRPIPELFNRADVDILALGNHEFEDPSGSYQNLKEGLIEPFEGEVLVANVRHADGKAIEGTKPYTIRQMQGQSIAFIGVVTRELTSRMFPAAGAALTTMPIEETLESLIPEVEEKGADAVVVLAHQNLRETQEIAENVPGVDLALAAHDHRATERPIEVTRPDGSKAWVAEADAYGRMVGEIDLIFDEEGFDSVEGRLHKVDHTSPSDPVAKEIVDSHEPLEKVKMPPKERKFTKLEGGFEALANFFDDQESDKTQ